MRTRHRQSRIRPACLQRRAAVAGIVVAFTICSIWLFPGNTPTATTKELVDSSSWQQLVTLDNAEIHADVRAYNGTLPSVLLQDNDQKWRVMAKVRNGRIVKQPHSLVVSFRQPFQLHSILLDWDEWYCFQGDYSLEGSSTPMNEHRNFGPWTHLTRRSGKPNLNYYKLWLDSQDQQWFHDNDHNIHHLMHHWKIANLSDAAVAMPVLHHIRVTIQRGARDIGFSLWRIQVFGWPVIV